MFGRFQVCQIENVFGKLVDTVTMLVDLSETHIWRRRIQRTPVLECFLTE